MADQNYPSNATENIDALIAELKQELGAESPAPLPEPVPAPVEAPMPASEEAFDIDFDDAYDRTEAELNAPAEAPEAPQTPGRKFKKPGFFRRRLDRRRHKPVHDTVGAARAIVKRDVDQCMRSFKYYHIIHLPFRLPP